MEVKLVDFNWHQVGSTHDRDGCGENYSRFQIGVHGVLSIQESLQEPYNYLINFEDGRTIRVFNPNYVEYITTDKNE